MSLIVKFTLTQQAQKEAIKIGAHKRGLNSKIHLAMDAHGMPVRAVTGIEADCTKAMDLIEGMTAEYLLADKGSDSNNVIKQAK
ncbi:hypothetical protein CCS41_00460 [Candidatus Fukatsuia symbiotica]|uniref:Uncharacterized protein n=1 Tax=Candidatus Fukatsuia symbiotica TaxID=1878942 RepID=A0A2U8I2I2_9GAMM|nr:hypothetical protein CCS41_00460 [Candidatus Fukatsuia symbiotica]